MSATKKPLTFDLDAAPAPQQPAPAAKPVREKPQHDEDRKQIGARVNASTYRQLKARAAMQDRTIGDVIEQAVAEFLINHPA